MISYIYHNNQDYIISLRRVLYVCKNKPIKSYGFLLGYSRTWCWIMINQIHWSTS